MGKKTTTNQIYETALKIFAKYGFRRTRVEDIAQEMDMATGTLYRYVKDKKDLYEKTVEFGITRWQVKVFEAIAQVDDIKARFITMCTKGYEYLSEDVPLREILIQDPSIFPLSPRKVRFPNIDNASISLIKEILNRGIKENVFRNMDVSHVAEFFYSIYVMFIIKTYIKSEGQSTQKMFNEGLSILLNGLLKTDKASSL